MRDLYKTFMWLRRKWIAAKVYRQIQKTHVLMHGRTNQRSL